jgi:RNA polymerase sigma-70 factor (ECF subfamily)
MPWPEHSSAALGLGAIGSQTSAGGAAARTELAEKVRAALQKLKTEDRESLVLRHFDSLTNAEAAEVLGVSQDAAAKRYLRALLRLREELAKVGVRPELFA